MITFYQQYWNALIKQLAEEEGEACDHWVNTEKMRSLKTREERKAYVNECYDICVIIPVLMNTIKFEKTKFRFIKEFEEKMNDLKNHQVDES
jgi:hypothetical protein